MTANVESGVVGRNMPAWHNLFEVVAGTLTMAAAMVKSKTANWNVRLLPLTVNIDGVEHTIADQYVNTRVIEEDRPNSEGRREPLAIVGDRYAVTQNEESFGVGDTIVGRGSAQVDTMGSLDGGRKVFASFLLPREFVIDEQGVNDRVDTYLLAASSHDGSLQNTWGVTNVRTVCQNTLTIALSGMANTYKVRHTKNQEYNIAEARELLKIQYQYSERFEREATAMFQTAADSNTFDAIIAATFGEVPEPTVKDGKVTNQSKITRAENLRDELHDIRMSRTNDGIRDTAWGAFNAIDEYLDYYRQVRGDADNMFKAHLDFRGPVVNTKQKAWEATQELAGVLV